MAKKTKASKTRQTSKVKKQSKQIRLFKLAPSLFVFAITGFLAFSPYFSHLRSNTDVLAYATNTSRAGLLSATNVERANNGSSALSMNNLLNNAAQSKAEDMVARNYWSHETPDGKQPWIFVTAAGYQYLAAGENLAFGYPDSNATLIGWMNSPPHKSNLLSSNYTEVGFGIANSTNFVNKGAQTVVVAMYGKPQVASAQSSQPTAPVATRPAAQKPAPTPDPAPDEETPVPTEEPKEEPIAVVSEPEVEEVQLTATPTSTSRVQLLMNGNAAWSATFILLAVCSIGALWTLHKGIHIRRYILAGEHFVSHHVYIDIFVLSVILLGFVLLATTGAIR